MITTVKCETVGLVVLTCHKTGNKASWIVPYLAMSSTALIMTRGVGRVQPRCVGQNLSASTRTKHRLPSSSTSVAMTRRANLVGCTQTYRVTRSSSPPVTPGQRTSIIIPCRHVMRHHHNLGVTSNEINNTSIQPFTEVVHRKCLKYRPASGLSASWEQQLIN